MFTSAFKPYVYNLILGCLACGILALSFIYQSQQEVNRQLGSVSPTPGAVTYAETTSTVPHHSDYQLPEPGLLPTNPFYKWKMVRDRIGLVLTLDPDRRALLLLHYADKRIAAALALVKAGRPNLAIETAAKAEAYLLQAIHTTPDTSPASKTVWLDVLSQAVLKHEEAIEDMQARTLGPGKDQLGRLHENLAGYRTQIGQYTGKPFGYARPEDNEVVSANTASGSAIPLSGDIPHL